MVLLIVIACLFFFLILRAPEIKGKFGEYDVKEQLFKLPKDNYFIFNDILLKTNEITHQIDHVVISKFGIFVIETKNYKGLIVGKKFNQNWIKYMGHKKYYFYNPLRQNYGHIKALEKISNINSSCFFSIICFSNQTKLCIKEENVINLKSLVQYISMHHEVILNNYDIENIIKTIHSYNIVDKKIRKIHIKNIKENNKF